MGPSWWHILIVLVLFVLLFGRGKISDLMGDLAKGIKSFKAGLADEDEEEAGAGTARAKSAKPHAKSSGPKVIEHETPAPKPKPRARAPRKQKSS